MPDSKLGIDDINAVQASLLMNVQEAAHDRLVDAERKDLLARVLGIVDLNISPEPRDVSRRRDRH